MNQKSHSASGFIAAAVVLAAIASFTLILLPLRTPEGVDPRTRPARESILKQDGPRALALGLIPVGVAALPLIPATIGRNGSRPGRAVRRIATAGYVCAIVALAWIMALLMVTLIGLAYLPSIVMEILAFRRHLASDPQVARTL